MKNNTFEVGIVIRNNNDEVEWGNTLLENATYDEAYRFCLDYTGDEELWLYDTTSSTESEFYKNGKQI